MSNETKPAHTPEPWRITPEQGNEIATLDSSWRHTTCHREQFSDKVGQANAARIVACVNACRHYRTEQLEGKTFDPAHSELSVDENETAPESG